MLGVCVAPPLVQTWPGLHCCRKHLVELEHAASERAAVILFNAFLCRWPQCSRPLLRGMTDIFMGYLATGPDCTLQCWCVYIENVKTSVDAASFIVCSVNAMEDMLWSLYTRSVDEIPFSDEVNAFRWLGQGKVSWWVAGWYIPILICLTMDTKYSTRTWLYVPCSPVGFWINLSHLQGACLKIMREHKKLKKWFWHIFITWRYLWRHWPPYNNK